jgi:von Willebrand factor type A domain
MTASIFGVSFLTPLDGLFVLVAAVPLAALLATERRADRIRALLGVVAPSRRSLVPVVAALLLLPALVAVAATQPVVVRQQLVHERADAQAFFVLDTSTSMRAQAAPGRPTRLDRAKKLALRLRATMPDVPVGIASMTDRVLPNLMPTTDAALFTRALTLSVAVDRPPPSQPYSRGRATNLQALSPVVAGHFFSPLANRRLLVVFTDGESQKLSLYLQVTLQRRVAIVFVHTWRPDERIFSKRRADPNYRADPTSTSLLAQAAKLTGGIAVDESRFGALSHDARNAVGYASSRTRVDAYARVALAPWVLLGGVAPLGFLFWRRNF